MSKHDVARMNFALMKAPLDSRVMKDRNGPGAFAFGLRDAFGPPGAVASIRPAQAGDCCPAA